ncbi:hypothetical protein L585_00635 [Pantoea ananatis BRT175]|nr:hypothetical protein L585_00635 [Pantoea ananatis BRT175]PKC39264.1 hypothetical protein V461_22410 [Pantoea ananatis BRT98]CCF09160.1 hypothetical protein PANA5342_1767 [Pantoea ananatis LMG 5342]CRH29820.1 Uncharacterized protein {ECO:0000313/EMBL:CCF09160.1} [Pantoea ananatis]
MTAQDSGKREEVVMLNTLMLHSALGAGMLAMTASLLHNRFK